MYYTKFKTHLCDIYLAGDHDGLKHLHMQTGQGKRTFDLLDSWEKNDTFFSKEKAQIIEYTQGKRKTFDIKLNPEGTEFQKKVWAMLKTVPYGTAVSYKDIAIKIGKPTASRAVGMANGKNPLPVIVPCHRVVGSNDTLTGFAHGLEVKKEMLQLEKLNLVYKKLLDFYQIQYWWPADTPYEMMVGAVLTQNTTWENVKKALNNFDGKLSPEFVEKVALQDLTKLIRPSGYYNQKAIKLKELTRWYKKYNYNIESARKIDQDVMRTELLNIKGVGRETADCILVYALNKPSFVIDTYTKRLVHRLGIDVPKSYDALRIVFEKSVPKSLEVYNEFHGLIVKHAKTHCLKSVQCEGCPLDEICPKREL